MAKQTSQTDATVLRTVAGIPNDHAASAIDILAPRLGALIDLSLTIKHVHWNVVGPNFLEVHQMLDVHAVEIRTILDETAERIRTLGGVPVGTPGAIVAGRDWDDYRLGVGSCQEHLKELDAVYEGVLLDHRRALAHMGALDPVTEDMLVRHIGLMEFIQWSIRSFLQSPRGDEQKPKGRSTVSGRARQGIRAARAVAADGARATT